MKKHISNFLKGVIMGAAMLIPGVSGGTTAIILGIYEKLINAVSEIFRKTKSSLALLFAVGTGGVIGIILFSSALLYITRLYEKPMMYLFLGVIIGSLPLLYKRAGINRIGMLTVEQVCYQAIGFVIVLLIKTLPKDIFEFQLNFKGYILLILSGFITAVALILPGISVSYVLLLMGVYDRTLFAIQTFDISFLLPLIISVALGVVLTSRLLQKLMERYSKQTFMVIAGFVVGSVFSVFSGAPVGFEWILCSLMIAIGFCATVKLSRLTGQ